MNIEQAKSILGDYIQSDGGLFCLGHYLVWTPGEDICLDSRFEVDELEAMVVYMRHVNATNTKEGTKE